MERESMNLPVRSLVVVAAMAMTTLQVQAQQHPHMAMHAQPPGAPSAPYAGWEQRHIKALSDEQIADLKLGRGMGLALAAELNGYPGPMHALEHAQALKLSESQQSRTKSLVDSMKSETSQIGERLLAAELELDHLFADKRVTKMVLEATVARIATLQGELRAAHLRYHLAMAELLSPEQTATYSKLRGYAAKGD
jgi:hypothetical protein